MVLDLVAEFVMGRVCQGPSLSWAEFVMGRDVPESRKRPRRLKRNSHSVSTAWQLALPSKKAQIKGNREADQRLCFRYTDSSST